MLQNAKARRTGGRPSSSCKLWNTVLIATQQAEEQAEGAGPGPAVRDKLSMSPRRCRPDRGYWRAKLKTIFVCPRRRYRHGWQARVSPFSFFAPFLSFSLSSSNPCVRILSELQCLHSKLVRLESRTLRRKCFSVSPCTVLEERLPHNHMDLLPSWTEGDSIGISLDHQVVSSGWLNNKEVP